MLMAGIATNSLIFGYAATVFPENDQIVKINAKLLGLLGIRITEAEPVAEVGPLLCSVSPSPFFCTWRRKPRITKFCQPEHTEQTEST